MPDTTKKTEEQVIAAIRDSGGILVTIALRLRVTRMSVNRYLARWPAAKAAYQEEVDITGDQAEKVILDRIFGGDVRTAMWYAELKLRDRGYGKPMKPTGGRPTVTHGQTASAPSDPCRFSRPSLKTTWSGGAKKG